METTDLYKEDLELVEEFQHTEWTVSFDCLGDHLIHRHPSGVRLL
jgi:hypothetical protein